MLSRAPPVDFRELKSRKTPGTRDKPHSEPSSSVRQPVAIAGGWTCRECWGGKETSYLLSQSIFSFFMSQTHCYPDLSGRVCLENLYRVLTLSDI